MSRLMIFGLIVSILCILYGDAFFCKKIEDKTELQVELELRDGIPLEPVPYAVNRFFIWPLGQRPQNHAYVNPDGYSEQDVNVIREAILKRLNEYRKNHRLHKFAINERLNYSAQKWANNMARKDVIEHTPQRHRSYGETLAGPMNNNEKLAHHTVDLWYSQLIDIEIKMTEEKYADPGKKIGYLTQILWKPTDEVGIGIALRHITGFPAG